MSRWLRYMAASAGIVLVLGGLVILVLGGDVVAAVGVAATIGLAVQGMAAALLFRPRKPGAAGASEFLVGWAGGALLRMMALLATGLWVTRTQVVAEAPALLTMVLFLFVLTLIEPLFLKTTAP